MNWFVWKDGARLGPYSTAELQALVRDGQIAPVHVACQEGSRVWKPLALIAEFAVPSTADLRHVSLPQGDNVPGVPALAPPGDAPRRNPPTRPTRTNSNYLVRHWRGELPLATSYWVNGILVSGTVSIGAALLSRAADFPSAPRFWSVFAIGLWIAALTGALWQVVGVWRSAGRHASNGGSAGWGTAARVAVVLGAIQLVVVFGTQAVPQIAEYGRMALGRDPINGSRVRLLRGGTELEVSGYIAFGLTDKVAVMLDAHPDIVVVHLNSDGGRVAEARKLRDLIADRRLSTYTSTRCLSACVIPFLAGQRRLIAANAKIGFHQYSFAGSTGTAVLQEMETDKRYFVSRGVSEAFVRQAFRHSDTLWYPTPQEMRTAGYVTGLAGNDDVGLSGIAASDIDSIDETLKKEPLYAAIAEHEPDVYRDVAAAVKEGFLLGQSLAELRRRTAPLVQDLTRKRLPFASDEAVVSFARVMVDEIAALNHADPEKCRAYLFPDGDGLEDVRAELGPDLVQREMTTMGDVIASAARGQWRPPSEEEIAPIRARLASRFALTWSPEDLDQLQHLDRRGDPARVCRVCYGLYRTVVSLPRHEAGPMLRSMFAGTP
jgi:hypothetical protein